MSYTESAYWLCAYASELDSTRAVYMTRLTGFLFLLDALDCAALPRYATHRVRLARIQAMADALAVAAATPAPAP